MRQLFPSLTALVTRRAPAVGRRTSSPAVPRTREVGGRLGVRGGGVVVTASGAPVRRLPWSDGEGRACYVVGRGSGRVSRMADAIESAQLDRAADLLDEAVTLFAEGEAPQADIRGLAERLARSLHEAYRVAESRGVLLRALAGGTDAAADHGEPPTR